MLADILADVWSQEMNGCTSQTPAKLCCGRKHMESTDSSNPNVSSFACFIVSPLHRPSTPISFIATFSTKFGSSHSRFPSTLCESSRLWNMFRSPNNVPHKNEPFNSTAGYLRSVFKNSWRFLTGPLRCRSEQEADGGTSSQHAVSGPFCILRARQSRARVHSAGFQSSECTYQGLLASSVPEC